MQAFWKSQNSCLAYDIKFSRVSVELVFESIHLVYYLRLKYIYYYGLILQAIF
jgi:hypothetical protein